jgi:pimeloyl-ACP methyl ester carboxylesterase
VEATAESRLEGIFVDDLPSDAGDDAPLVVLVHGTMDRHASFARVRSRLMDRFHVVSYDRRGYAASREALPAAESVLDHVLDLEAVVAERPCTVAGHSYGGVVALALAERRPDLVHAVLAYEPPLPWMGWWPQTPDGEEPFAGMDPSEAAEEFLARAIGRHRYDRLPLKTREEVVLDGEALVTETRSIRKDGAPFRAEAVAVPVLLVMGSETAERHQRACRWLAERIPAASLHTVDRADHGGHLSHPSEFATLVAAAAALAGDPAAPRPPGRL